MAPPKTYRTYQSGASHTSTSIDVFNTLIAKNLTQRRVIQRRNKLKLKLIPLRLQSETCLSDESFHVNRDDTFEKIKKGPIYNPVKLVDTKILSLNNSSESDTSRRFEHNSRHDVSSSLETEKTNKSKTNVSVRSPIITRLRNRKKSLSSKLASFETSSLAGPANNSNNNTGTSTSTRTNSKPSAEGSTFFPSLLIEKEKRYIEPAWLSTSLIKLPSQTESNSITPSAVSSTPFVTKNFRKFVMNTLSPLHQSTRFNCEEMKKSFEEISDWNHSLSLQALSQDKSISRRRKSDSFLIDSMSGRSARKFTKTKAFLNDRKLFCSPRVVLIKAVNSGSSAKTTVNNGGPLITSINPQSNEGSISALNNSFLRCDVVNSTEREILEEEASKRTNKKPKKSKIDISSNRSLMRYELRPRRNRNNNYSSDLFSSSSTSSSSNETKSSYHYEPSLNRSNSNDIIMSTPQFVSKRRFNARTVTPYIILNKSNPSNQSRNFSPILEAIAPSPAPIKACFVVCENLGPRSSTPKTDRGGIFFPDSREKIKSHYEGRGRSRSLDGSILRDDNKNNSRSSSSPGNSKRDCYVVCESERMSLGNCSFTNDNDSRNVENSDSSKKQCYVICHRTSVQNSCKSNEQENGFSIDGVTRSMEHSDSSNKLSHRTSLENSTKSNELTNGFSIDSVSAADRRSMEHSDSSNKLSHRTSLENSTKSNELANRFSIDSSSSSSSVNSRRTGHSDSSRKECYVICHRTSLENSTKSNEGTNTELENRFSIDSVGAADTRSMEYFDISKKQPYVVCYTNSTKSIEQENRFSIDSSGVNARRTGHSESSRKQCYVICHRPSLENSTKSNEVDTELENRSSFDTSADRRSMEHSNSSKKQSYVICHRSSLENSTKSNKLDSDSIDSVDTKSIKHSDSGKKKHSESSKEDCSVICHGTTLENSIKSNEGTDPELENRFTFDSAGTRTPEHYDSSSSSCKTVLCEETSPKPTKNPLNSKLSKRGQTSESNEQYEGISFEDLTVAGSNNTNGWRRSGVFSESPARRSCQVSQGTSIESLSVHEPCRDGHVRGSRFSVDSVGVSPGPGVFDSFVAPKPVVPVKPGKSWRRSLAVQMSSSRRPICSKFDSSPSVINRINLDTGRSSVKLVPINKLCVTIADDSFLGNVSIQETEQRDLEESIKQLSLSSHQRPPRATLNGLLELDCDLRPGSDHFVNARDIILQRCGQTEVLPFQGCYPRSILQNCQKIGEGVYGEVFLYRNQNSGTTIMKVIPIEGDLIVNGERQKKYEEILSEILIAMELSNLRRNETNNTSCFTEVCRVLCVQGKYPARLVELWELFDETKHSENDSPEIFPEDQLYVILELTNGGTDLESYYFNNASQALSVFKQTACALAVAENELEFEHRDLHWGNVLVSTVDKQKKGVFVLEGKDAKVATGGVEVTIIDFTLSRMLLEGVVIYNDLSMDPDLFTAKGDYQFDIYRLMQERNNNNWQSFEPYSNVLWLHYLLTKMVSGLRYKNVNTKTHKIYLKKLEDLKEEILDFASCKEFVQSRFM